MGRASALRSAPTTRDRILDAAILRFSKHSYQDTGLRDIATDVGVDVAYVHRCFGSKQKLFAEAVKATVQADRIFANMADGLADTLASQVFAHDPVETRDEVGPLDILIHSLSSPEAASILREFILQDFAKPLSCQLGDIATHRAVLITAFLAGISIFRNVLRIEDLRSADGDLKAIIANVIEDIANGSTVSPQRGSVKERT